MSRVAYLDHQITLTGRFFHGDGTPADPPEVELRFFLLNGLYAGPYSYTGNQIHKMGTGVYQYTLQVPHDWLPNTYEARFSGTVDASVVTLVEQVQVLPPVQVDLTPLLTSPNLRGTMRESPLYQTMGVGLTDRVFLLGHADGLPLNDPTQVVSVQEVVNKLGADSTSPLLRALLEVYYAGCRDVYLMAVAPMSEYVADPVQRNTPQASWGGMTFYQKYLQRLDETYRLLLEWDIPQMMVPVEASFTNADGADFLTQLVTHCQQGFDITGVVRIGILGCRGKIDDTMVATTLADDRLNTQGGSGKFVAVVMGEGVMNMQELPSLYSTSVASVVAGELAGMRLDRGLCYHKLRNVVNPTHYDLDQSQIKALAKAKVNVLTHLPQGKRGVPFNCCLATDNTVGQDGSDYWSLLQVRLIGKVIDRIRALGRSYIGTAALAEFQEQVHNYLVGLTAGDTVRDYKAYIRSDQDIRGKVLVDVVLKPYYGIREISFGVEVGPEGV